MNGVRKFLRDLQKMNNGSVTAWVNKLYSEQIETHRSPFRYIALKGIVK